MMEHSWDGRTYRWEPPLDVHTPVEVTHEVTGETTTAPFSRLDLQSQGRLSVELLPIDEQAQTQAR
jgi:hypothetical protein